ncbi:MAG: DNA/RNA nuclease SfsA [Pseudomonadota bacterium]
MEFPNPLIPARLVRRYKRFLADAILEDGTEVTAHCPNSGSMMGLKDEGMRIWLEPNDDPKKKLKYGWRVVELPDGHFSGIDTMVPNRVVKEALHAKKVTEVAAYSNIQPEVKYREGSRVDFLLREDGLPDVYLEVKNVHLRRDDDWAEFPDSVTSRGAKHLGDLTAMVAEGHRAVMLYLVQRTDCARLKMAADLDPTYAQAFEDARAAGVEMLCYGTHVTPQGVWIAGAMPIHAATGG